MTWLGLLYRVLGSWPMCLRLVLLVAVMAGLWALLTARGWQLLTMGQ